MPTARAKFAVAPVPKRDITHGWSGPPPPCQGGRCAALEPLDAQGHGPYLHRHHRVDPLRDPAHATASYASSSGRPQRRRRCDRRACPTSRDGRLRLFVAAAFAATCRSGCRGCSGCGGLTVRHQPEAAGRKRWQGAHVAAAAASRALCAERRVHAVRRHVAAPRLAVHMHCTCTAHALHMHCTCTAHALHIHGCTICSSTSTTHRMLRSCRTHLLHHATGHHVRVAQGDGASGL